VGLAEGQEGVFELGAGDSGFRCEGEQAGGSGVPREPCVDLGEVGLVHVAGVQGVVDGAGEARVGEPGGGVQERAGGGGDADPELGGDVSPGQRGAAVDLDACGAAVAGDDDLERGVPVVVEPPEAQCRAVAERGAGAACEHGRRRALQRCDRRFADAVDARVDAVKPAGADAMADCVVVEADRQQLHAGHVRVLAAGDRGDRGVPGYICSHTAEISQSHPFRPVTAP
jgi:hypothetical protein